MSWLDLAVEIAFPIICVTVFAPLLIWCYVNAETIVEWMAVGLA